MDRRWRFLGIVFLLLSAAVARAQDDAKKDAAERIDELGKRASDLFRQGRYAEARPLAEQTVTLAEQTFGSDDPTTLTCVNNLASVLWGAGDLREARVLLERVLAGRERSLGKDAIETAGCLHSLARVVQDMDDPRGAKPLFERSLAILEKTRGPDHLDTARALNDLARALEEMGELKEARPLLERAVAIREKGLGEDNPETAESLTNLAVALKGLGDLNGARPLLERALAACEKTLGPEHRSTAALLSSLAILLQDMGDLPGARRLLERSLAICDKVLGPDNQGTAAVLNDLANVVHQMGDPRGARPLLERAMRSVEKSHGPDDPLVATCMNNLAELLRDMGELKEARTLFERALATTEKARGPEHMDTAQSLNNLASLLTSIGDNRAAIPLFERALAINEKVMGPSHPYTAITLNNLADAIQCVGDMDHAKPLYERAWRVNHGEMRALLPGLSSRERGAMLRSRAPQLSYYLHGFADAPAESCSAALAWKGAAMRANAATMRMPSDASNEARRMYDNLADARRELAKLAMSPPAPKEGEASVAERYEAARKKVEGLERRLSDALPDFAARAFLEVGLDDVRKALPEGAALLDTLENCGNLHAWVVRPSGDVKYFALGKTSELEPLVARFREALEKDDEKGWKEAGHALRERIEKPLAAALEGTKTLYVSPDGALATVPWGLLLSSAEATEGKPDGEGFLVERLPIVCVSGGGAGLVMATKTPRKQASEGMLCVGGVDYEKAEGAAGKGTRPERQASPLPSTAEEAREIAKHFLDSFPKTTANLMSGPAATVAAFAKLAPSARYIHVATHGYFDLEHLRVATEGTRGFSGPLTSAPLATAIEAKRESIGGWNPLLLSGMVFAGANAGDGGNGCDGLLTAEELQGLDLTGTELVVLSACDTGRGELAACEGVLGLSRALFVAGAHGFMLSLWEVPDRATRELMDAFYENLWDKRQGFTAEGALRAAQLRMLLHDRVTKSFHPSTWGAWVLLR